MDVKNRPKERTIGDFIRKVFAVKTEEAAKKFFDSEMAGIQAQIDAGTWKCRCSAVEAARSNIGWCFGEGMSDDRIAMWVRACKASHPVFGTARPSPQEAFEAGNRVGRHNRLPDPMEEVEENHTADALEVSDPRAPSPPSTIQGGGGIGGS